MKKVAKIISCGLIVLALPAWSLNIVLTNDDSWKTENINVLKRELEKAGHDVIMSTPCTQQSGKGGSFIFLNPVPVDDSRQKQQEYCVGDTDKSKPFAEFVEGTPVMASLYGIDQLAQKHWGKNPDLLISGPNEGNNLGILNNNSGTLGATMMAIAKGVPAIAVSAGDDSGRDAGHAPVIAAEVLKIIALLEKGRKKGQPLLPPFTGLNINFPNSIYDLKGYKFTRVGWNPGVEIIFSDNLLEDAFLIEDEASELMRTGQAATLEEGRKLAQEKYSGKGISFKTSDLGDKSTESEGYVVEKGYITISTIDASIQASDAKVEHVKTLFNTLKYRSRFNKK